MTKFLLLLVCLGAGMLLRRTPFFDEKSPLVLNNLLIYFFIPVLTFYYVPKIQFAPEQIWLSLTPFIVFGLSFVFFRLLSKSLSLAKPTEGALILCSGIGSISFVGFPIFELLYGQEGLSYGIILSLAGTFLVFNTLGIATAFGYAQSGRHSLGFYIGRMLRFPPFMAFVMASSMNAFSWQFPEEIMAILQSLSAPFSVLALLAIGMQIDFQAMDNTVKPLLWGQFFKLFIAPLAIYLLMWHLLGVDDLIGRICVLGAAIGSMNAISIVAAQKELHPQLAVLMPAIGIPVSIPLLFLIDYLLT